jgi:hypothetical protein
MITTQTEFSYIMLIGNFSIFCTGHYCERSVLCSHSFPTVFQVRLIPKCNTVYFFKKFFTAAVFFAWTICHSSS